MWREQHDHFFGEANISIFERQQFTSTLCFMQVVYNFSTEWAHESISKRLISANPGLIFLFCILPCYVLLCVIITQYLGVKANQYFLTSSGMFLDKKHGLKFGFILGET